jgi:cytochrome c-type biogenesis protein CcmF
MTQPHPMPEFGTFSLMLALALSVYTLAAGAFALWCRRAAPAADLALNRLGETARRAGIASFAVLSCAAFALVWAAFTNDYSVAYILQHTNRDLNPAYKFSALWSGQEGSLLLWAWLLSAYGFVLRLRHRVDVRLTAYASTIMAGIQVFFLLLLNVAAPRSSPARSAPTATASIHCSSTPRWSSIRRCSTSATSASRCRSPSPSAR